MCLLILQDVGLLSVEFHLLQEADAGVYVLVHDLVDVDKVHALAVVGHKTLDEGAALETFLVTEVECLGSIEKLDGHDALGVFHDLIALCGSVAAHADEVFLILTAGDAVDAAGEAELFALADDGGSGILGNHESAVETGFGNKEAGQTTFGVDKLVGAALADAAEFCHGNGEEVEYHSHGFTMEMTAGDDHVLVGEDNGVVGGGVDFGLDHRGYIGDGILGGTVYLGSAAEAVGILHVLFVAGDNLAALGVFADGGSSFELSFVGTHQMKALVERLNTAIESVEAEGEEHVGLTAETLGFEDTPHGVAAHELGAVEEGETLFALQFDGLPSKRVVYFLHIAATAFPIDVAKAEDGGEHEVGQGAEVAAGTEAALLVDDGQNVVVVAVDETLDGLQLGTAVAKAEVLGFEQEHETDDLGRYFVADATGVAHDEVLLQLAELLFADGDVAEGAETGGDTVNGYLLGFHLLVEVVTAFLDATLGLVAEGEGLMAFDDFTDLGDGETLVGIDIMGHNEWFCRLMC